MIRRNLVLLALVSVFACSRSEEQRTKEPAPPPGAATSAFTISSPSFSEGGSIPARHTCEGNDTSPALSWTDPPSGTKSFALVVDDPDAPDPKSSNRKTFVHWVMYNVAENTRGLPEGRNRAVEGARDGQNGSGKEGYMGPCPPSGRHRYVFKLYALDAMLPDLGSPQAADVDRAMDGHVIGRAQLIGMYQKGHGPRT
jgi:Raf kinase inhibitor-like YbhB/YbcL family protein